MVEDERSLRLLSGIVQLSHRLGLQVTVEGVETFEQLKMLSVDVKPDLVQGFLFGSASPLRGSRPCPPPPGRLPPISARLRAVGRAAASATSPQLNHRRLRLRGPEPVKVNGR